MKASELIKILEQVILEHGDINVTSSFSVEGHNSQDYHNNVYSSNEIYAEIDEFENELKEFNIRNFPY